MNRRNVYFVPFQQDDYEKKPRSMVACMELVESALDWAIKGLQIQPMVLMK